VQIAQQRDLRTVVQHLLVDPPHDLEERLFGVAAVGVGAVADGVERLVVGRQQRRPPRPRAASNSVSPAAAVPLTSIASSVNEWSPTVQSARPRSISVRWCIRHAIVVIGGG